VVGLVVYSALVLGLGVVWCELDVRAAGQHQLSLDGGARRRVPELERAWFDEPVHHLLGILSVMIGVDDTHILLKSAHPRLLSVASMRFSE